MFLKVKIRLTLKKPSNVVSVPILRGSNPPTVAASGTPGSMISNELFISGTVPSRTGGSSSSSASEDTETDTKTQAELDQEKAAEQKRLEEEKKKQEEEKKKQEEANQLTAPGGLSANYDPNSKQINASWGAVSGATGYQVTINGQTSTVTSTSITVAGGSPGSVTTISVAAIKDGKTSSAVSTSVRIPQDTSNGNASGSENNDGNNNSNGNNGGGTQQNEGSSGTNSNTANQSATRQNQP